MRNFERNGTEGRDRGACIAFYSELTIDSQFGLNYRDSCSPLVLLLAEWVSVTK